jgi:hypothetical protein
MCLRIQNICHSLFSVCLESSYIRRIPNYYYALLSLSASRHHRAYFLFLLPFVPSAPYHVTIYANGNRIRIIKLKV